jgi:hypothetical protein
MPSAPLVQDTDGTFYGLTSDQPDRGAFRITPGEMLTTPDYSFGTGSGAISLVLATTGISSLRTGSVANGTEVVFHKLPASSYK